MDFIALPRGYRERKGASEVRDGHAGYTVEVDSLAPGIWDDIAASFEDMAYDQTACYSDGLFGRERMSHLLLQRDSLPIAGARVAVFTLPAMRSGVAFVRFGPFWRRKGSAADMGIYRAIVSALVEEYCGRRGHYLTLIPRANPEYYSVECQTLSERGFVVRRPSLDRNYFVDLSLSPEAQMQSLDKGWRYTLRKALNSGLETRLCDGPTDLATFMMLHQAMSKRKRIDTGDAIHLLPALSNDLPASLRPRLVLTSHEGRPVAGAVVGLLGDTAYYVFGASDGSALPLNAGYALQWWIINWLAGQGIRWYNLFGGEAEPGLHHFKKGFAGKRGTVVSLHGEYDWWPSTRARSAADVIYGLRRARRAIRALLTRN